MFGFDVAGGVYVGAVWYGVLTGLPTKGIVLKGVPLLDAGGLYVGAVELMVGILPTPIGLLRL